MDIVKELREFSILGPGPEYHPEICDRAADEIERLYILLKMAHSAMVNCPARDKVREALTRA